MGLLLNKYSPLTSKPVRGTARRRAGVVTRSTLLVALGGFAGFTYSALVAADFAMADTGRAQHAGSAHVVYDRVPVLCGELLKIPFAVAHDPLQLNHRGPNRTSQHGHTIFNTTKDRARIADAYIEQLSLSLLMAFYEAEDYHQNYASRHPDEVYISLHNAPTIATYEKAVAGLLGGEDDKGRSAAGLIVVAISETARLLHV
jgi:peptide-methionine (S)-S-oxide reductase